MWQSIFVVEATMDLNLVSTFVKVAEASGFTAAARALGLPTSSVSRKVSALEAMLKVRLIQRSTRKLVLTEAGRAYFERARASLAGLADATSAVADMSHDVAGPITVDELSFGTDVVAAGVGIGFVATIFAEGPRARARGGKRAPLVNVLPEYRLAGSELNLVSPPTAYEPTRVSLLRDFLA